MLHITEPTNKVTILDKTNNLLLIDNIFVSTDLLKT